MTTADTTPTTPPTTPTPDLPTDRDRARADTAGREIRPVLFRVVTAADPDDEPGDDDPEDGDPERYGSLRDGASGGSR